MGLTNGILIQEEISCNPCQKTSLQIEGTDQTGNEHGEELPHMLIQVVGWLSSVTSHDATTVSAANRRIFQGKKSVCHTEHCCCDALEVVLKQGKARACLAYDGSVQNSQGTQTAWTDTGGLLQTRHKHRTGSQAGRRKRHTNQATKIKLTSKSRSREVPV